MRGIDQLPKRLGKEPLVDVVFELRFAGEGAEQILPGFLFGRLHGEKSIEALPIGGIPVEMRRANPQLASQPTTRITWKRYKLLCGDGMFAIACVLPYPGWQTFKPDILELVGHVIESGVAKSISRTALKYVDLFDGDDIALLSSKLNAHFTIGGMTVGSRAFQLNAAIGIDGIEGQIVVGAPANVMIADTGAQRKGLVITVDTYVENKSDLQEFLRQLENSLDQIHGVNKQVFFSCLTDEAIQAMEPKQ